MRWPGFYKRKEEWVDERVRRNENEKWEKWFAWYPVLCKGDNVWLETVYRKKWWVFDEVGVFFYNYRTKEG